MTLVKLSEEGLVRRWVVHWRLGDGGKVGQASHKGYIEGRWGVKGQVGSKKWLKSGGERRKRGWWRL